MLTGGPFSDVVGFDVWACVGVRRPFITGLSRVCGDSLGAGDMFLLFWGGDI